MSIADQFDHIMKDEKNKLTQDGSFAKILRKIDELKEGGILSKKSYRFPMPDTLGRRFGSKFVDHSASRDT